MPAFNRYAWIALALALAGTTPAAAEEGAEHWAFQPVRSPAVPEVADGGWSRNEIDRFIFARLAEAGHSPAREADRATLIRRVTFDLTGLPPTPEEMDAFLTDESPDAYERLVERLLASPRYGEQWARHWLDLVRYAESDGYKADGYRPEAWRYRDYVIRSLNSDKPYDRFVLEQLAGDEIAPADPEALVATGYLRLGIYEYNQRDVRGQWTTILNDLTDVTADVFLGMGLSCARCHDHKFDPLLQKDYYRLQAFFAPLLPRDDVPLVTPAELAEHRQKLTQWEERTADLRRQLAELAAPLRQRVADPAIDKFPPDIRPIVRKPLEERTPLERQLAELAWRQVQEELNKLNVAEQLAEEDKARYTAMEAQLAEFNSDRPAPLPAAPGVTDVGPVAPPTFIPDDYTQEQIEPGFLSVLDSGPAQIEPPVDGSTTGRRTALARWITSPENPLATRVIVNRVWQHHFGRGLAESASNLGRLSEPPSHPELLDWLAARFLEQGRGLKGLHRVILTSAVYRQASVGVDQAAARQVDPGNRLLWRMNVRRLGAEQIRDALLAVSGELDLSAGGPSAEADQPRRSIYLKVVRNRRDPLLDAYDCPDGFNSVAQRNVTTTPLQSLLMLNGPWTLARAGAFAERLKREASGDTDQLITRAFQLACGRSPDEAERTAAAGFLEQPEALIGFCHVLLNANATIYVD